MSTFALSTKDQSFDPHRPITVNGFLFMPAGGKLSVVDERPVPKRPAPRQIDIDAEAAA